MKASSGLSFTPSKSRLSRRIRQRKEPVQGRARQTVESIVEATLQVLVRDGYGALTTTKVAERAGVSVGTLYQYFPDKRSLVTALKVHYFEQVFGKVAAVAMAHVGQPIRIVARAMIETLLSTKRANLALTLALREPLAELGGESFLREATRQLVDVTRIVLVAGQPDLEDPEAVARVVIASVDGVMSSVVFDSPRQLESKAFADDLVALVVGYVRERGRRRERTALDVR